MIEQIFTATDLVWIMEISHMMSFIGGLVSGVILSLLMMTGGFILGMLRSSINKRKHPLSMSKKELLKRGIVVK